jgi:hypothetical protein
VCPFIFSVLAINSLAASVLLTLVSVIVSSALCAVAVGNVDETKSRNKIRAAEGKFFEVKLPRPDKYWNPKVDKLNQEEIIVLVLKKLLQKVRHT